MSFWAGGRPTGPEPDRAGPDFFRQETPVKPIPTAATNFTYLCPNPAGTPLPCQRTSDGRVVSVWAFTPEERAAIAAGQNLELHVWMQPPPPVGFALTPATEAPMTTQGRT